MTLDKGRRRRNVQRFCTSETVPEDEGGCRMNAEERARLRAEGRRRAAAELPDITPECARHIAELLREPINQYVAKQRRNRGAA
jgi:hypothetical protein